MFRWSALDHLDEYKAIQLHNEGKGGNTVRVFTSTSAMHKRADSDLVARTVAELKAGWQFARGEAIEAFRFAALGGEELSAPGFGDL
jgi:hypothetical protein